MTQENDQNQNKYFSECVASKICRAYSAEQFAEHS